MVKIGFHASHEQFAPGELLQLVWLAEQAGFRCAKSSDHFQPWSERQGQAGFAWAWLGAAMQLTKLPFGMISAPGYRYHPAILAQAAATIGEMYPGRLWLSLGSGEAINEAITGLPWPEKAERNAKLKECVDVIRALFAGDCVTHRGRITVVEAKLYTRPKAPIPLYAAAMTEETARFAGTWADGLLTAGGEPKTVKRVLASFRESGGARTPVVLQHALSWSPDEAQAEKQALDQWGPCAIGGEVNWDLRRPADFDAASRGIGPAELAKAVFVSSDLARHEARLAELAELGVEEIYLHQVGRNQQEFIEAFGDRVLPSFSA
jgi:probable non-F420 flavinoid oxidoreductase